MSVDRFIRALSDYRSDLEVLVHIPGEQGRSGERWHIKGVYLKPSELNTQGELMDGYIILDVE